MPIGPIMLDLPGTALTSDDRELLQNPLVGGVILFSRNYTSAEQLADLIYNIRDCRNGPILVAVDQEGGRVQRFKDGFSLLPPISKFGEIFDENPELAIQLTEKGGWLMAIELLAAGIDLSFAPVLDLNLGISQVIGDRAFHANPEIVALLAKAYITGMNNAGMKAVGKHFPGHGSVAADSHTSLPTNDNEPDEILTTDIIPFVRLCKNELAGIMTAHIIFSKLDTTPVTFSNFWLQNVLRKQAGFVGAIFSDDLLMAGAEIMGNYSQRAHAALAAGCDMILVCNNRTAAIEVLEQLAGYEHPPLSQQRLLKMCGRFQHTRSELLQNPLWQQTVEELKLANEKAIIS
jgi:beta-N-acetylhexosaminidase